MADNFKACSVANCNKNAHWRERGALGLCYAHYKRLRRYGDPEKGRTSPGKPRAFLQLALQSGSDDCLIWPYSRNNMGYAQISWGGRPRLVHRLVCEAAHGASPKTTLNVAHSCGNGHGGCINPKHLRWATTAENLADRIEHGTSNRGERQGSAKLTEADVIEIRALNLLSTRELAARFGVSGSTIWAIIHRKTWGWLDP